MLGVVCALPMMVQSRVAGLSASAVAKPRPGLPSTGAACGIVGRYASRSADERLIVLRGLAELGRDDRRLLIVIVRVLGPHLLDTLQQSVEVIGRMCSHDTDSEALGAWLDSRELDMVKE